MCVMPAHVCLYCTCVPGDLGGEKKSSDSLGLELGIIVSYYVGAGYSVRTSVLNR